MFTGEVQHPNAPVKQKGNMPTASILALHMWFSSFQQAKQWN